MSGSAPPTQRERRIERRECPEHGPRNILGDHCRAWKSPYVFCDLDLVTVEYVPAGEIEAMTRESDDGLIVAVEKLQAIAKLLGDGRIRWEPNYPEVEKAMRIARGLDA